MQKPPVILGMHMPDIDAWSERVITALGQNPGVFTGPGTNTYLVGTGKGRLLLDPGEGRPAYLPVLEAALARAGDAHIEAVVLTHGHPDHIGGVRSVLERFGPVPVWKFPSAHFDAPYEDLEMRPLADGQVVECEGARLRAVHTPGHAPDHLCFVLEEEGALFSGDNVLGVGTTVIPLDHGDLAAYLDSLARLAGERPGRIYPAHGPLIEDGAGKIEEYIKHRQARETQVLDALARQGAADAGALVREIYAAYPEALHAAAAQSVGAHLLKLESEGRVSREGDDPLQARWRLSHQ